MKTKRTPGMWVLFGLLVVALTVSSLPFLWMILTSFKTDRQILGQPDILLPLQWTLIQYQNVIDQIPFFRFLLNSFIFAGGVTILSLFFDAAAGYAFAKLPFPGRDVMFYLVLITLMIPFQVVMVPLYLLIYHLHSLDTFWGLILPRMTNAFGIYFMRQFFLSLPNELLDAGRIDGLNEIGIYRRIAVPMTTSALATLGVFHFMYNWNDFLWPLLITTSRDMRPLPVGLALFTGEHVQQHGPIVAGAVLSIIPILIFFLFAQKTFMRGIALSGLKG
ncbi:MAG TPA: carbohydrate ABC transporter permease [Spirochaetia bacterium]|nr:carbohydrate ABC transporter permease [Spirochaetia bacterium]